ncbi:MFS transporter [Echinimonas agarilytica]|uniref:MFS transporter n=1 Tax=Echinimonas agarilytica TaxID=1215918 RepID=A0AA42B8K7_9GAMM|nr:MFS transporter [Echinimonas agarilytica]MCM2681130.1 MFS transporter [Echinimonas agarilytica]
MTHSEYITGKTSIGLGYIALFFVNQALFALAIPFFQMTLAYDPVHLSISLAAPIGIVALLHQRCEHWLNFLPSNPTTEHWVLSSIAVVCGVSFSLIWWLPTFISEHMLWLLFALSLVFHFSGALLSIYIKGKTYLFAQSVPQKVSFFSWLGFCERSGALVYYWLFPLAQLSLWGSLVLGMKVIGSILGLIVILGFLVVAIHFLSHHVPVPQRLAHQHQHHVTFNSVEKLALCILLLLVIAKIGLVSAFSGLDYYVLVYYVSQDLEQGSFWKGVLSSSFALVSIAMVPVVKVFLHHFKPIDILKTIYAISFIGSIGKWYIFMPNQQLWLVFDALLGAASFVSLVVIVPMLLSDVAGVSSARLARSAERKVAALQNQTTLLSILASLIISGILLKLCGFDASLAHAQSDDTITLLRLALSGGTALFNLVSLALLFAYPLISKEEQLNTNYESN